MLIRRLREATAADHAAVEGESPLMRADLDVRVYRETLARVYGVVLPWEQMAERLAPAHLGEMVRARSRRDLLLRDLQALGQDVAGIPIAVMPELDGTAGLLGAMYVMEGSRLGGQLIARHVELTLGDAGKRGDSYLRGFGDATGEMWKQFVQVIEDEVPDSETERTIAAARWMFAVFGSWMTTGQVDPAVTGLEEKGPSEA